MTVIQASGCSANRDVRSARAITARNAVGLFGLILALLVATSARAENPTAEIHIKNHRFEPTTLKVPAGERIKLTVHNEDASPEEFESHSLRVEKVITGNNKAVVYFGPLEEGSYSFMGEFHRSTAKGKVIAR